MEPHASALGPHQRHPDHHHAKGRRCGARTRLLAVLALAAVAGCTTIALQLLASNLSSWPGSGHKAKGAMPAEFVVAPSSAVVAPLPPPRLPARSRTTSLEPGEGKQPAEGTKARPYGDADLSMVVPGFRQGRRRPLVVDRRFTGQRTGRPPNLEEEASLRSRAWHCFFVCMRGVLQPFPLLAIIALHSLSLQRMSVEACSRNEYTCM